MAGKHALGVCILYGGRSGEHEVSRRSAAAVVRHLDPRRYRLILVGIDPQGAWHLQSEARFLQDLKQGEILALEPAAEPIEVRPGRGLFHGGEPLPVEVVFPVLHGTFGEDGTVQGLLECAGLAYVGAGVMASAAAMDKEKTKSLWRQAGLPVLDWAVLRETDADAGPAAEREAAALEAARKAASRFDFPLFVKPASSGSSVGISRVADEAGLKEALALAFRFDNKVILEPGVKAREIECAVLGNERPEAFEPGEVIPSHEFYTYAAKYLDPEGARLQVPADLPEETREEVKRLAIAAFTALDAEGMARVDLFLDTATSRLFLNEINTIPGFTSISMYPRMCAAGGLPFPRLLDRLISLALERNRRRQRLLYSREGDSRLV